MLSVADIVTDEAPCVLIQPAIDHALSACGLPIATQAADIIRVLLADRLASSEPRAWRSSRLTGDGFPFEIAFCTADDRLRFIAEPGSHDLEPHQRLDVASELIGLLSDDQLPVDVLNELRAMQSEAPMQYGAWIGCRVSEERTVFKLYAEVPPGRTLPLDYAPLELSDRRIAPRMLAYSPAKREFESYVRVPSLEPCHLTAVLAPIGMQAKAPWLIEFLEEAYGYSMRGRLPGPSVGVSYVMGPACAITLHFYARALWGSDARIRRNFARLAQSFGWDTSAYLSLTEPIATRESWQTFHGIVGVTLTHSAETSLTIGLRPVGRLCLKNQTSGLDTVSTGSGSDLVSNSLRYFRKILDSHRLTRSLPLPVLTVSKDDFGLLLDHEQRRS